MQDLTPCLVVDIRNALYRAIYAAHKDGGKQTPGKHIAIFWNSLAKWMTKYKPRSVHICWDVPRDQVWRRKYLPTYKDRSSSDFVRDISADLVATQEALKEILPTLGCRQYLVPAMEADDMIHAVATVMAPNRTIIVSGDSDMVQTPFAHHHVTLFNPQSNVEVIPPSHPPALVKALIGDETDSIPGYHGVGPVTAEKLANSPTQLEQYLKKHGREILIRNLLLIDHSACPHVLANQLQVRKTLAAPAAFDRQAFVQLAHKHKIMGMLDSMARVTLLCRDLK